MRRSLAPYLIAAVVLVCVTAPAVSADHDDARTVWRVRAGVNSSTFAGDDAGLGQLDRRAGFIAGTGLLFRVSRLVSIEAGAYYSQKGGKGRIEETPSFDIPLVDGFVEGTARFHYVEFPLLVDVTLPVSWGFEPHVFAGPAVALATTTEIADVETASPFQDDVDLAPGTTDFDILVVVGAAAVIDAGTVDLLLDLRWSRGMKSVDDSGMELDLFNSTVSFMAGIGIPLSGPSGDTSEPRGGVFQ